LSRLATKAFFFYNSLAVSQTFDMWMHYYLGACFTSTVSVTSNACLLLNLFCIQAKEEGARGDRVIALQHARTALYLNIAAIVFGVVVWIIWIASVAASA